MDNNAKQRTNQKLLRRFAPGEVYGRLCGRMRAVVSLGDATTRTRWTKVEATSKPWEMLDRARRHTTRKVWSSDHMIHDPSNKRAVAVDRHGCPIPGAPILPYAEWFEISGCCDNAMHEARTDRRIK